MSFSNMPEQTVRMNRPVDYRTDLYSLGVTFYELVIGQTPFISADPLELAHTHLTKNLNRPSSAGLKFPSLFLISS